MQQHQLLHNKKAGAWNVCEHFGDPAVSMRPLGFPSHPREWFSIIVVFLNRDEALCFCWSPLYGSLCLLVNKKITKIFQKKYKYANLLDKILSA